MKTNGRFREDKRATDPPVGRAGDGRPYKNATHRKFNRHSINVTPKNIKKLAGQGARSLRGQGAEPLRGVPARRQAGGRAP